MTIRAHALYPYEGTAFMQRSLYDRSVGPEWPPSLSEGDEVQVHDEQEWIWTVRLLATPVNEGVKVEVVGDRRASPLPSPEVQSDGTALLKLPNISGHAHTRAWQAGDIVRVGDSTWKVKGRPKYHSYSARVHYALVSVPEESWATRAGRIVFSGEFQAHRAIGTAVEAGNEWLHVKKIQRRRYGSAEGETFGYTYVGSGNYVSAEKAQKINDRHAPSRLQRAIEAGVSMPRDWTYPSGTTDLAIEVRNDFASPKQMVVSGQDVYYVNPVYDDSPIVTRLAVTPKTAKKLAKDLGWKLQD